MTCRCPRWPACSAEPCTPPRRCWSGPGRRSAPRTRQGEGRSAMPDPFDALRDPVTPVEPDPAFAARLRDRLERALALPEGVAVTDIAAQPVVAPFSPVPEEHGGAVPSL